MLERIRKLDPNAETIDTELDEIEKRLKPTKYDELKADKKKVDAALTDATKELEKQKIVSNDWKMHCKTASIMYVLFEVLDLVQFPTT